MFMSAREIQASYRPLPGDFREVHDEKLDDHVEETVPQFWGRKLSESKMSQADYAHKVHQGHETGEPYELPEMDWDKAMDRTDYPAQHTGESTDDHGGRVEEWEMERMRSHGNRIEAFINGPSLYSQIERDGVQSPVHLGTGGRPPLRSAEEKTILGGHHRVAAAADIDPDRLMPVLHYEGGSPKDAGRSYQEQGFAGNGQQKMITRRKFTGYDYT
jgi:hypothetical protein